MRKIANGVLSFTLLLSVLNAQGELDARSAAKKGDSAWLVHETIMAATVELQGQEVKTAERVARTLHVQIKDVDAAGNYLVETKIVRMQGRLELAAGQGDFSFDSGAEGGEVTTGPMTRHLTEIAGKSFIAKVSPSGEVIELGEGAAAILDVSADRSSMQLMTSDAVKQLVADLFGLLPTKRTAGGAMWKCERVQFHGRLATRQKLDLRLTEVEPEAFEIEATGTLDLAKDVILGNKELMPGDGAEAKRQLESTKVTAGKLTSTQKMSREDGFVLQANGTLTLDLETSQSQMGEVKTHLQVTTSITRTTAEAAMPKPRAAPADGKK